MVPPGTTIETSPPSSAPVVELASNSPPDRLNAVDAAISIEPPCGPEALTLGTETEPKLDAKVSLGPETAEELALMSALTLIVPEVKSENGEAMPPVLEDETDCNTE